MTTKKILLTAFTLVFALSFVLAQANRSTVDVAGNHDTQAASANSLNAASVLQDGDDVLSVITQTGSGNAAPLVQSGNLYESFITQTGDNNTANIRSTTKRTVAGAEWPHEWNDV
jgi:hypothetical protein